MFATLAALAVAGAMSMHAAAQDYNAIYRRQIEATPTETPISAAIPSGC